MEELEKEDVKLNNKWVKTALLLKRGLKDVLIYA